MSSIEKRLRDELGELASWLIDNRAESSSVEQADSGSDSLPRLDLGADPVRSGGWGRLFRVAAVLLLIVGAVSVSRLLSEDPPSVVTVPTVPATQSPTTSAPTTSVPPTTTVDDLSTGDPVAELLPDELDPEVEAVSEVERDVAPPGALYESSAETEEWLIGPFRDRWWGDPQAAPWLFPWGDGFLQIGFANTSEQIPSEMNLFARTSVDGLNWGEAFQLDLPRDHFEALETDNDSDWISSWPIIRSNGNGLVVLSQLPGRHFGARGAEAATHRHAAPPNSHLEQRAFVSVTDDLETWNHYEYPLFPPDDVDNPLLGNHVVAEDVIVTDEGWMIQLSTLTYMDIGLLVPAEIRNATERISWSAYDDDVEYVVNEGLHIKWRIEDTNTESTEFNNKLYSWEELGITRELYYMYGALSMKPYHFSDHFTGSLLVGKWGEGPVRVELPPVNGVCCEIVITDAGYVGLSDAVEPGYAQGQFGWGALIFSSNGLTWQHIEPPGDEGFKQPPTLGIWIPSVHVVEDRIVMYGQSWGISNGCDDRSLFEDARSLFEFFWVGDARGSNWESQNISNDPCAEWYRVANSAGRGVLVYSEVSENPETSDTRYHSTIVSTDGVNWFTFYEEPDPKRSSVAFNGNVAVRVDNAGNSFRYELQ